MRSFFYTYVRFWDVCNISSNQSWQPWSGLLCILLWGTIHAKVDFHSLVIGSAAPPCTIRFLVILCCLLLTGRKWQQNECTSESVYAALMRIKIKWRCQQVHFSKPKTVTFIYLRRIYGWRTGVGFVWCIRDCCFWLLIWIADKEEKNQLMR